MSISATSLLLKDKVIGAPATPRPALAISAVESPRSLRDLFGFVIRQPWMLSLGLLAADVFIITLAYLISREIRTNQAIVLTPAYLLQVGTFFGCILVSVGLIGGYKPRRTFRMIHFTSEFILAVLLGAAAGTFFLFVGFSATPEYAAQSRVVLLATAAGFVLPALGVRFLAATFWNRRAHRAPYLAVGEPEELRRFRKYCREMAFHNPLVLADTTLNVIETLENAATSRPVKERSWKLSLSSIHQARDAEARRRVLAHDTPEFEGVILTDMPEGYPGPLLAKLARMHFLRLPVYTQETFFSEMWRKEFIQRLDHYWAIRQDFQLARHSAYRYLKSLLDHMLAAVLLLLALPVMVAIAAAILIDSGRPVFFVQERIGRGEHRFRLFKFRTMKVRDEEDDPYTRDGDSRITRVGALLRRTRLDELPQLLNVLRGEMSLIGPRAEWSRVVEQYEKKIPSYHLRHLVKPGITGWAQVNYRYGEGLDDAIEKLRYDLFYIKNYSLVLDVEILLKTILKVCSLGGK